MKIRLSFLISIVLLFGILVPTLVFAQEGQPPYAPAVGKVWVWEAAHWTPAKAWFSGYSHPPQTPPPVPPRARKYWRWVPSKWVLVKAHPDGPHDWKPANWDPVKRRWIKGGWIKITIIPEGKLWVGGAWDPIRKIWIGGHWGPVPPPPVIKPPPPIPPGPPVVVKPPPPGPIPPKPVLTPKRGFHWEWDPVHKRWVQRHN